VLTHVVLLRLADPADRAETVRRLQAFVGVIEALRSLSAGPDGRGTENSWDVALVTTHDDLDGLNAYLTHPVHQEFTAWLAPRASARAVVDFVTDTH
jgi:hypothetical protein